jgi:hypothetical protein
MSKNVSITRIPGPDGKAMHPLLVARASFTPAELAKALGHKNHTTVSIYCAKAKRAKNTRIPAEWVLPLSRLTGISPAAFRPDVYLPHWTVDNAI